MYLAWNVILVQLRHETNFSEMKFHVNFFDKFTEMFCELEILLPLATNLKHTNLNTTCVFCCELSKDAKNRLTVFGTCHVGCHVTAESDRKRSETKNLKIISDLLIGSQKNFWKLKLRAIWCRNKHLKIATQIWNKNQMNDDTKVEMKSNKNPPS